MVLPSPNLDDRTFEQIRDEAVRLIPQYCPEWTNFNPSDPGITLVELFSWMTEMVLYRLNRVPEKVYLALLDMIGVRLRPPQPARTFVATGRFDSSHRATTGPLLPQIAISAVSSMAARSSASASPPNFSTSVWRSAESPKSSASGPRR